MISEYDKIFDLIWNKTPLLNNDDSFNIKWDSYIECIRPEIHKNNFNFRIKTELKAKQLLLDSLSLKNTRGQTIFYLACRTGDVNLVKFLHPLMNPLLHKTKYMNLDGQNFLHGLYWLCDNKKSFIDIFNISLFLLESNNELFRHFLDKSDSKGEKPIALLKNILLHIGFPVVYESIDYCIESIVKSVKIHRFISSMYLNDTSSFNRIINYYGCNDLNNLLFDKSNTNLENHDDIVFAQHHLKSVKSNIKPTIPTVSPSLNLNTLLVKELINITNTGIVEIKDKMVNDIITQIKTRDEVEQLEKNLHKAYYDYLKNVPFKTKLDVITKNIVKVIEIINNEKYFDDCDIPKQIRRKLSKYFPMNELSLNLLILDKILTGCI